MTDILDSYLEEASQDAVLDVFSIKDVQSKLPAIKHKWVGRLMRSKRRLNELNLERDDIRDTLIKKAKEQAPYNVSNVALEKSLKKTQTMKGIDKQIKECKLIIDFLERTERVFSSMTFDIKNLTEVMKLETM